MSNIDKQALREVAEKATKGEWWSDVVDTDGEYGEGEDRVSGYHSYAVYVGHESLLDMINSTAACIHTEWDHDYHMTWDETAKRNAEFIAAANPDTVLALLDENIQLQREKDAIEAVALALRDDMRQAREQLEESEKRNVELESKNATVEMGRLHKRIAELEAREVNLSKLSVGEVMHMSGFSRDYADGWCAGNDNAIHEIRTAGIKVKES
ncbi:ead/Ea22-like family protein [Salmonella enterica subsp. enterica serovar Typhimurium]|nr:ead/Ea22-like family protein [Salmonella enterica subsp. enterica serovar Typhimurium]EGM6903217.1 ead/Ea22-like family protein [Salmonella enterica subsp. enterica serovar Typhimurium]